MFSGKPRTLGSERTSPPPEDGAQILRGQTGTHTINNAIEARHVPPAAVLSNLCHSTHNRITESLGVSTTLCSVATVVNAFKYYL